MDWRRWFPQWTPRPPAVARLFCFPYATGAASVFRKWDPEALAIEICAVELPGHGTRLLEPPIEDADRLITELRRAMAALPPLPYVVFGHSLGGLLAAHVAAAARADGNFLAQTIVSATRAPPEHAGGDAVALADDALERALSEQIPEQVRGTPSGDELLELYKPAMRADWTIFQQLMAREILLPGRITALAGEDDPLASPASVAGWSAVGDSFTLHRLPGGHFYSEGLLGSAWPIVRNVMIESLDANELGGQFS